MYKATDRKAAAHRIAELTGEPAVYTRVPRCAYEIGPFTIERDGNVTLQEGADPDVLATIAQEGLLEGQPENNALDRLEADTEAQDAPEATVQDLTTTESITLPIDGHTSASLKNLISMVYSRGGLISKATGGIFSCTEKQVRRLQNCVTIYDVIEHTTDELKGIIFTDTNIIFTGFSATEDPEIRKAFTQLAMQMCLTAKKKRTLPKKVDETNERYIFRIWLLSLGMTGDEFKVARHVLMEPLSGSMAFRTKESAERFRENQRAKRMAGKADKEAIA